jgi:hypothetical protein
LTEHNTYYAFLDENNIVTEVIAGPSKEDWTEDLEPETWYGNFRNQVCKETSFTGEFRANFAGRGYTYDHVNDVFIPYQPYPSWTLDADFHWQPPVTCPDLETHVWDESALDWVRFR